MSTSDQDRCEAQFPSYESDAYYAFLRRLDIANYTLPPPQVVFNAGVQAGVLMERNGQAPVPLPRTIQKDDVREIFLKNGFTVKEGNEDLKEYVYAAAAELLKTAGWQLVPTKEDLPIAMPGGVYDTDAFDEGSKPKLIKPWPFPTDGNRMKPDTYELNVNEGSDHD